MQGQLLMMPSSSQVLDHLLIFHIMYGLGQFHYRQNKGEERRREERFGKKKQQLLSKHRAAADGKRQDKSWVSPGRFSKKSKSCLANIEQVNTQGIVMHSTKDLTHRKNSNQQYQQQDSSSINSRTTIVSSRSSWSSSKTTIVLAVLLTVSSNLQVVGTEQELKVIAKEQLLMMKCAFHIY